MASMLPIEFEREAFGIRERCGCNANMPGLLRITLRSIQYATQTR